MAFGNNNNNNNGNNNVSNSVFSGISFTNPDSTICPTRFSISYFNKMMKIVIAPKSAQQNNPNYITYDNDQAAIVYISQYKCSVMYGLIKKLVSKEDPNLHNVAIELNDKIFKVSDGTDFGSGGYCFSIIGNDNDGNIYEAVYETKTNYTGICNYNLDTREFDTMQFPNTEIEGLMMTFHEYFKASSYAIAATCVDADATRFNALYDLLNAVANKNGVGKPTNGFTSRSFLANNPATNTNTTISSVSAPQEYSIGTFEDIASGM